MTQVQKQAFSRHEFCCAGAISETCCQPNLVTVSQCHATDMCTQGAQGLLPCLCAAELTHPLLPEAQPSWRAAPSPCSPRLLLMRPGCSGPLLCFPEQPSRPAAPISQRASTSCPPPALPSVWQGPQHTPPSGHISLPRTS